MPPVAKLTANEVLKKEEHAKRIKLGVAYFMLFVATVLVVIVFGGERFKGVRDTIGLSRFMASKQGLYANCPPGADGTRFCSQGTIDERARQRNIPRSGRSDKIDYNQHPGDFVPFSLHGDE